VGELAKATKGLVVLDDAGEILGAYRGQTNPRGQPGPAELFLQWLIQVRSDRRHCRRVALTRQPDGEYSIYPSDAELAAFDRNDRIYVAVAIGSGISPEIVNATDTDWQDVTRALERYRIRVRNLCV